MNRSLAVYPKCEVWTGTPVWWGGMLHTLGGGFGAIFAGWAKWDEVRPDFPPPSSFQRHRWSGHQQAELEFALFVLGLLLVYATVPLWVPFQILTNLTARVTVRDGVLTLRTGILFKRTRSLLVDDIENVEAQRVIGDSAFVVVRARGGRTLELRRHAGYQDLLGLQKEEPLLFG